ncbi:carboxymuconolactone decarboxylase family protein [Trichormus azollae]|jgi:AhpD family alkylhydroperoxidase|uniref:Alkylhydroperoxidase like protein, AhpD family n=1 Tax=Nostoc azollae (strain 0708) TaxID=551115 RepID=D7DYJ1_NOSA0|nr:alkylhydroperoxidase like protein, AhpD family ['Nostoc azollae' 0708]
MATSKLPHDSPCCGKKKDDFIPDSRLLNPLTLPTSSLFKFSSKDGEIRANETACIAAGIPVKNVQFTIDKLGLNIPRLKDQRLVVIDKINKELDDETFDINDLEEKVAGEYFDDGTGNWPRFFTTLRWVLGAGAEGHLTIKSFWKALANHPPTLRPTWENLKEIMADPGEIDPLMRELIYIAVSVTNGCEYCIASHSAAALNKGITHQMFGELMAITGATNMINRFANGYKIL